MNKTIIVLSSLVSIFFVSTITLIYLNYLQPKTIVTAPVQKTGNLTIPTSSPTKTSDPTANWKTYTNTKYNFSIKHPSNWISKNYSPADSRIPYLYNPDNEYQIQFSYNKDEPGVVSEMTGKPMVTDLSDYTPTTINGIEVYVNNNFQGNDGKYMKYFFQISPGEYISISAQLSSDLSKTFWDNEVISLAKQILSTFKFTDSSVQIPSSISSFYTAVNSYFKSNIAIVPEKQFYSPQGMINKPSWKLDVSKVNKAKGLVNTVFIDQFKMSIGPNGGGAGGSEINEFVNDKLDCYFSTGFTGSGGPDTWNDSNSYSIISCIER